MNKIPEDIFKEICLYLNDYENLKMSICAKLSSSFSCTIDKYMHKKKISVQKLIPYITLCDYNSKNPLLDTYEDLISLQNELITMNQHDRNECIFACLFYFIKKIFKDYHQNIYIPMPLHFSYSNLHTYYIDKFGVSNKKWGNINDFTTVKLNVRISCVYRVSCLGHQYRQIRKSLLLKALVG